MDETTRVIIKGIRAHYMVAGEPPPDRLAKAIEAVGASARGTCDEQSIRRYHIRLGALGDALGVACWRKDYQSCRQKMLPRDDRIRIELPIADLGFKRMMPNDRGIEMLRFGDEQQAWDAARSIERLELSISDTHRPPGHSSRQAMIRHWWPLERKRA